MSYYHVRLYYYVQRDPPKIEHIDLVNIVRTRLEKEIIEPYLSGESFELCDRLFDPSEVAEFLIRATPSKIPEFYVHDEEFVRGADVTAQFLKESYPKKTREKERETKITSKDVFIVHGRDHEPLRELQTILKEVGLNPVVLHEQPSGSMTIIEKLEKYSEGIGFAFVLLTTDDALVPTTRGLMVDKKQQTVRPLYTYHNRPIFRARQNTILEFGFFIARIGRKNVCCLYKESTELPYDMPSDMHGIVYIPFKNSINDVKDAILKELAEVGYDVSSRREEAKEDHANDMKKLRDDVEMLKRRGINPR